MSELRRRQLLLSALMEKKEEIEKYVENINKSESVYIDTNSQLKYWLDIVFSVGEVKVVCALDDNVKWVVSEKPYIESRKKVALFVYTQELIRIINECIEEQGLIYHYFDFWDNNNTIIAEYKRKNNDKLVCTRIDLMITEKCSLKCKDCLNLMQYYKNPEDYEWDKLKNEIDTISRAFDEVIELRILGGEPFINKEVYNICAYACQKENIDKVIIFSNATIMLDEQKLRAVSNEKCYFYLSKYGLKNQKIEQIILMLRAHGYQYYVADFSKMKWIMHSGFEILDISKEDRNVYFEKCEGKICPTVSKGKVYLCEFLANAMNLKAIPFSDSNFIDLNQKDKNLREKIKQYLFSKDALPGCSFCSRLFPDKKEYVAPAVQCNKTLDYRQY